MKLTRIDQVLAVELHPVCRVYTIHGRSNSNRWYVARIQRPGAQ